VNEWKQFVYCLIGLITHNLVSWHRPNLNIMQEIDLLTRYRGYLCEQM